jgi:hypothetical protein
MQKYPSQLAPEHLSSRERIKEVAHILAVGFHRLRAEKTGSNIVSFPPENLLTVTGPKSVHRLEN